jgi:hypothetical protein
MKNGGLQLNQMPGGEAPFVVQYLVPVIYQAGLTAFTQYILGGLVIAVNLVIYGCVLYKHFSRRA